MKKLALLALTLLLLGPSTILLGVATLGGRTGDLLHEHRAGHAAAAGHVAIVQTLLDAVSYVPGVRVGAKAGYDLTWPFGTHERLEVRVPAPPKFEGKRFASVEAALADGPKFFEELMTAVGSRDGREVVRTLGGLRDKLALDRDGEGRYFIKK